MSRPYRYILFNKPFGVLSQFSPEGKSRTLAEFNLPKEVYPVGRLDKDSEGLLLLSNDGPFIARFLEDHHRCYWVCVEGTPAKDHLEQLRRGGIEIKGHRSLPLKAKLLDPLESDQLPPRDPPIRFRKSIPDTWIELQMREGKNRQIRRMTAKIGLPTLRLFRVGMGHIRLFQNMQLEPGQWLEVSKNMILKGPS
jgi:23S rRNA pseudouridine2457 synthase